MGYGHGYDGPMGDAIEAIVKERHRQNQKWGEQNHPDGTSEAYSIIAKIFKKRTDDRAKAGTVTWLDILSEETMEAFAETEPASIRAELVQVAAVCVQWIEAIDRRERKSKLDGQLALPVEIARHLPPVPRELPLAPFKCGRCYSAQGLDLDGNCMTCGWGQS